MTHEESAQVPKLDPMSHNFSPTVSCGASQEVAAVDCEKC